MLRVLKNIINLISTKVKFTFIKEKTPAICRGPSVDDGKAILRQE